MVSISILLYGQLLQVIGYIETRTDIKYDEKEDVVNMCKAQDDHKKLGIQEGIQQGIQQGMQYRQLGLIFTQKNTKKYNLSG